MLNHGEGVVQGYKEAHTWWNIAAVDGNENASKNRAIIEKKMFPEDVGKALEMAREWMVATGGLEPPTLAV